MRSNCSGFASVPLLPYLSNEMDLARVRVEPTLTGEDDQRDKKGEACEWGQRIDTGSEISTFIFKIEIYFIAA